MALVFTGDEFADGGDLLAQTLKAEKIHGSFFLTGNFYRNKTFTSLLQTLKADGNYLGSHSNKHLLYNDWVKRDSLLVTRREFEDDLLQSYAELKKFQVTKTQAPFFLPPYEWYNDSIASWTRALDLQLINFTPGTRSNADYTYPQMAAKYIDSKTVMASILNFEKEKPAGLSGFMLLVHIGTDPRRTDKFYRRLPELIAVLKNKGYRFVTVPELLTTPE